MQLTKRLFLAVLITIISFMTSYSQASQKTLKIDKNNKLKYSQFKTKGDKTSEKEYLIIALHWGWGQEVLPSYYSKEFLQHFVAPICKNQNSIIIAPDCPDQSWITEKSVNSIKSLRKFALEKYKIDPENVVLLGFSLGGIGTWFYSLQYPELFPYCLPIAGYAKNEWLADTNARIYSVNSYNDEVIPLTNLDKIKTELENDSSKVIFKTIYGPEHYSTAQFIKPAREGLKELLKLD